MSCTTSSFDSFYRAKCHKCHKVFHKVFFAKQFRFVTTQKQIQCSSSNVQVGQFKSNI